MNGFRESSNDEMLQLSQESIFVGDSLQAEEFTPPADSVPPVDTPLREDIDPSVVNSDDEAAANAVQWFEQLEPQLKLIDIPIEKLGHLSNLNNAFDIPYHWLGRVREIFSLYLKKTLEATTDENRLKYAVRYKLLPVALLGKSSKSGRSFVPLNKLLTTRTALLKRDDWSQFRVENYTRPKSTGVWLPPSDEERRRLKHRRVTQLVHNGEIGKGARRLVQQEVMEADRLSSQEMLAKLQDLHPQPNPAVESLLSVDMQRELAQFQASPENNVSIDTRRLLSLKIFRNKLIKGGFAKARYEHLAELMEVNRSEQSVAARHFTDLYVRYLELLINGDMPQPFYRIMADIEVIGIQKPKASSKDVRPIGFNDIDRRIAFAYLTPMAVEDSLQRFAAAGQVANLPAAAEKYIFAVQASLEKCPTHDVGDLDAQSAFQKIPQDFLMYAVMKTHPWMYPWVSRMYGGNRRVFVCLERIVHEFSATMGVTQGCVGAGYLYNLVTIPLLERIREVLHLKTSLDVSTAASSQSQQSDFSYTPASSDLRPGAEGGVSTSYSQLRQRHRRQFHEQEGITDLPVERGAVIAYYDNITFHTQENAFDAVLDSVIQSGPRYGYELNMAKTKILLGVRASRESALERKQQLMDKYGLPADGVRIHADNCADDVERAKYGLSLLGGYIGHPDFIKAGLQDKINQLNEEKKLLIQYEQYQNKFVILQRSFMRKFNHLLRTTQPDLIRDFAVQFDLFKKEVVESIVCVNNKVLDEKTWRQMGLKVNDGGLGLTPSVEVVLTAYIAGVVASYSHLPDDLQRDLRSTDGSSEVYPNLVSAFRSAVALIEGQIDTTIPIDSLFSNGNIADKGYRLQESLQDKVYDVELQKFKREVVPTMSKTRKKIYVGTASLTSAAWLAVVPHKEDLRMSSLLFQASLCRRYYLDQPTIGANLRCTCKKAAMIDPKGVHLQQFCGIDGFRTETHNALSHCVANVMRGAGCLVRTEQRICPDNGRKSDVATNHNPLGPAPLHIDCMVTSVHEEDGEILSNAKALLQGRAAEDGYQYKVNDYGELPTKNNFHFLPFIVENHGFIHPQSLKLLEVLAAKAELTWRLPSKVIFEYWLKVLSVTVHRAMANSIVSRARTLTSGIATSKRSAWKPIIPEDVREYMYMNGR